MTNNSDDFSGKRFEQLVEFCRQVDKTQQTPDLISFVASETDYVGYCRKIINTDDKFQKHFAAMCRANSLDPDVIRKRMRMVASVLGVYKQIDYYKILGVPPVADQQAIKRAYRKKAQIYHPDTGAGNDASGEEFVKIHDAYVHLSDPEIRSLYDQTRHGSGSWIEGQPPPESSVRDFGFGRFLSWVFVVAGAMVIIAYGIDYFQNGPLDLFSDRTFTDLLDEHASHPTGQSQVGNGKVANSGAEQDSRKIAELRKHFPEPTPPQVEPSDEPGTVDNELTFFNPRREKRYWANDGSRHDNLEDAVESLAVLYSRTPVWVQAHMGEDNALQAIHRNLSLQQSIETSMSIFAQPGKKTYPGSLEISISKEPLTTDLEIAKVEPAPEPEAEPAPEKQNEPAAASASENQTEPVAEQKTVTAAASLAESQNAAAPTSEEKDETETAALGKSKSAAFPQVYKNPQATTGPMGKTIGAAFPKKEEPKSISEAPDIKKDVPAKSKQVAEAPKQKKPVTKDKIEPLKKIEPAKKANKQKPKKKLAPIAKARTPRIKSFYELNKPAAQPTAKVGVSKKIKKEERDYAEAHQRVRKFLEKFTEAYEQKDLNRFRSFFSQGALEQGKPFSSMVPTYRKTFKTVEKLRYHISMQSLAIDNAANKLLVEGNFTADYRMPKKEWGSSSGSIRIELLDLGIKLLVSRLDYEIE